MRLGVYDLAYNIFADDHTLFTDDTTFLNKSKSEALLLQKWTTSLNDAVKWYSGNSMKVNAEKTQELVIIAKRSSTDSVSFLGVTISAKLNWKQHLIGLDKKTVYCTVHNKTSKEQTH